MALSQAEMKRLAELARLDLSDAEFKRLGDEMERVLGYVGRLSKVNANGVPETEGSVESDLRQDVAMPSTAAVREQIIADFPDKVGDLLKVPAVFETPKG